MYFLVPLTTELPNPTLLLSGRLFSNDPHVLAIGWVMFTPLWIGLLTSESADLPILVILI